MNDDSAHWLNFVFYVSISSSFEFFSLLFLATSGSRPNVGGRLCCFLLFCIGSFILRGWGIGIKVCNFSMGFEHLRINITSTDARSCYHPRQLCGDPEFAGEGGVGDFL